MGQQPLGRGGSVRGPPRGAVLHARITGGHSVAARIRNGSEDPVWRSKCERRSRRETTLDTVVPGAVRMSLTGTAPEKFSTSSRKILMTKIPERSGKKPDGFKWKPERLIRYALDESLAGSVG